MLFLFSLKLTFILFSYHLIGLEIVILRMQYLVFGVCNFAVTSVFEGGQGQQKQCEKPT